MSMRNIVFKMWHPLEERLSNFYDFFVCYESVEGLMVQYLSVSEGLTEYQDQVHGS